MKKYEINCVALKSQRSITYT